MSRPSFQFYPGDWQKNANLRRCSPAARGVWIDILCLLHDSESEYGVLRWPLKDIANAASAPMSLVKELVSKGVLKGADKDAEPYVFRPKHAGKVGEPVILVAPFDGPVWYSSRFVRDEYVRQKRGESTRFDTANQPDSRSPKVRVGEPQGDGPSSSSSPSGSVAKATGGQPPAAEPEDPKRELYAAGKSLLELRGMPKAQCGSFITKLAKDHGQTIALEAVRAAVAAQPLEATEYLVGACQRLKGERKDPVTVPSAEAERTAAMLAEQAAHAAVAVKLTPEKRAEISARLATAREEAARATARTARAA
jgi:hypothetical protein